MAPRNRYYDGPRSDHFDGTRFFVPGTPAADKSIGDLLRFSLGTRSAPWPRTIPVPAVPDPPARIEGSGLRVTAIGHATHLIQTRGLNLLLDPVWSERASPLAFAGPKRVRAPGLRLDQLPPLDAILVTHNHYDHLDLATLDRLRACAPCRVIVPLGNDAIIQRRPGEAFPVEAYDWDTRIALSPNVAVTLLPAHHWSARRMDDRRMALWAAFLFETPEGAIYHVGDTAFRGGALFGEVPRRFGPPRLAILPIGAYAPRWFMEAQHCNPEEAIRIMQIVGTHAALGHHWGTFKLTSEPIDEPRQRLAAGLAAAGIAPERFRTLLPGEAWDVPLRP